MIVETVFLSKLKGNPLPRSCYVKLERKCKCIFLCVCLPASASVYIDLLVHMLVVDIPDVHVHIPVADMPVVDMPVVGKPVVRKPVPQLPTKINTH